MWAYKRKPTPVSQHFIEALSIIGTKFLLKVICSLIADCCFWPLIVTLSRLKQDGAASSISTFGNCARCYRLRVWAWRDRYVFATLCALVKNTEHCIGSYRDHLDGLSGKLQAPISTMIMEAKAEDTFDNGFGQAVAQCAALRNSQRCVVGSCLLRFLYHVLGLRRRLVFSPMACGGSFSW